MPPWDAPAASATAPAINGASAVPAPRLRVAFLNPQGNFDRHDSLWNTHPDFGGQLVYVKELSVALSRLGVRVDIVTRRIRAPGAWSRFADETDAYADVPLVRIVRLPCGGDQLRDTFLPKEELWPWLDEWVDHILAFYRRPSEKLPQALVGHYGDGGYAAARISEATGIPFLFTAHSLGAQKRDRLLQSGDAELAALVPRLAFAERLAAERRAMARAHRIVVSTEQERVEQYAHPAYRDAIDVDRRRGDFVVIAPGVNRQVFGRRPTYAREAEVHERVVAALARDIAPASRRALPVVVLASRLVRQKNHLAVLQAFRQDAVLRQHANVMIVTAVGCGHPEAARLLQRLRHEAATPPLHHCACWMEIGTQPELGALYRTLATHYRGVFCLCALYEPFGLALLEAMASGLPVVATRHGGPSESLRDGCGVLVDPTRPDDIARGLQSLVLDRHEWQRRQALGLQRAAECYTWDAAASQYLKVTEEAVEAMMMRNASGRRERDSHAAP